MDYYIHHTHWAWASH